MVIWKVKRGQKARPNVVSGSCIQGYFCLESVFNFNRKVLTKAEISVLEKGLDFALIQSKLRMDLRMDY